MKQTIKSIFSFLILLMLWHGLVLFQIIDPEFFPSPLNIMGNLFKLLGNDQFLPEIMASTKRLIAGTLIGVPLAVIFAAACVHSKFIEALIRPLIAFTYPLPKVAIIPLLMLIFGIGDAFKIAVISLGMFYLIFINLHTALLRLKSSPLNNVIVIYEIKKFDYLFQFLIKGVLLDFLVGLKLALGYGLTLVVVSEFTMSKNGIGNFIWKAWDQFKIIDMYSGIFFLCIIGFFIYATLDFLISRSAKYYNL